MRVERKWRRRGTRSKISIFATSLSREEDSHVDDAKSETEEAKDISSRKLWISVSEYRGVLIR